MGFLSDLVTKAAEAAGIDLTEVKENLKEQAESKIEEL